MEIKVNIEKYESTPHTKKRYLITIECDEEWLGKILAERLIPIQPVFYSEGSN